MLPQRMFVNADLMQFVRFYAYAGYNVTSVMNQLGRLLSDDARIQVPFKTM